ncbi:MAG: hypothetical protein JW741_04540 [Sedimentisphaerales bacterium]|nr:hypothetical protein [Sedimentisphaerales bacterium]
MKAHKRTSILLAVLSVFLTACPDFAGANVTTGSWFMDESNVFSDGVNYGRVDITADDSSGVVSFVVTAADVYDELLDNFRIQEFGFNYTLASNPGSWAWALPTGWDYDEDKNMGGGFGKFMLRLSGPGTSQDTLAFGLTVPAAEAVAMNFAAPSTEGYLFSAHVADFKVEGACEDTSHKIAGGTRIPVPGAVVLAGFGAAAVGWLRRRKIV